MVAIVVLLRQQEEEMILDHKTLAIHVRNAARSFNNGAQQLFTEAFEWMFGKKHNVQTEAELAAKRFEKRGTFSDRTFQAITQFLQHKLGIRLKAA